MPGRILIVDDVPTNRVLLKARLSRGYYDILDASDGKTALALAREEMPDIILLDVMLPDMNGYEVCRQLKADAATAHIPVVMITALNAPEEKVEGLEAGADDFLAKPINEIALFARVRTLMRMKLMIDELHLRNETIRDLGLVEMCQPPTIGSETGGQVLMAPPDASAAAAWSTRLSDVDDIGIAYALTGQDVLDSRDPAPDVYVINHRLADGSDGLRLLSSLRSNSEMRMTSIIFAAAENDIETATEALELGASDYITAPIDGHEMAARVRAQLRRKLYSDRLRTNVIDGLKLAAIDPLTGLYNRRYAQQHMEKLLSRSKPEGSGLALLMMDLDEFKRVNDKYGHAIGDKVLCEFAQRLRENVRGVDLVARLGGEEFCIGMPDISVEAAVEIAERVRAAMETRPFVIDETDDEICVTVSVGIAASAGGKEGLERLIRQADVALYDAKNSGRNQVILAAEAA